MRGIHLGLKRSEETRKKLSEAHKNSEACQRVARENIKKAQQANIGKAHSEETRRKISEAHKKRRDNKYQAIELAE